MRLEDINFEEINYHDISNIIEKISKIDGYEDWKVPKS
jgi:hypothetical protein